MNIQEQYNNGRRDFLGADLRGTDLRGADLRDADLRGADLRNAVLWGADLAGAVLAGADLRDSVLRGADLEGADLVTGAIRKDLNALVDLCAQKFGARVVADYLDDAANKLRERADSEEDARRATDVDQYLASLGWDVSDD